MSYKDKPQIKLYKYENSAFVLQAIIDDFQEVSFEHNIYEAGTFTITINYNIPNALLFQRGLFCQFGNNPYDFGEIITIQDAIGQDGKGSQIRTITGRDARYILKRRVIKNMNSNGLWAMTAKGELVLRNLIKDQCGSSAEAKRQLPITNAIPASADAKGKVYSVSENFTNLYEVCKTIATQSEIGWRLVFDGSGLSLEVFEGADLSQTVRFDTNFESLANGEFSDSSDSYSNAIYIGGKGQNDDRDIYEGEDGTPEGLERFESWDNQSSLTVESEYEAEALSMLTQYGQTLTMNGNGLAKCPYVFREQYDIGDTVTVAFSGKSAKAQILSITEHWTWGAYDISFAFGKPQNNLSDQLQLMLRKIQEASNKTNSTDSVRWYTIPTDTAMPKADVTYSHIGFIGTVGTNATFTLYLDNQKTGAKTYHVYFKQLGGSGKLTLTTGKVGASNLVMNAGTYVAIIYVDENGNVRVGASTPTSTIASGNNQPATSDGVSTAIDTEVENRNAAINTAETNAKNLANATGILAIEHGGTGQSSIGISNIRIGSAQAKITLNQLMTWLITTKAYIPSNVACFKAFRVPWDYAGNDILQLAIDGINYELQLAGCIIEFIGNATNYNSGVFRLRIHSSPTVSFTETSGYTKFPTSHIAEYTCNGSGYSPVWKMLLEVGDCSRGISGRVVCSTAAGTAAKTVELPGFKLTKGSKILVYLNNANTAQSALTLNVNGTGAKPIRWNGTLTSASAYAMTATDYSCWYDGTNWNMDNTFEAYSSRITNGPNGISSASNFGAVAYTSTEAGVVAKTATCYGYKLIIGQYVKLYVGNTNTAASPTLNIASTGAKSIFVNGVAASTSNLTSGWYDCFYDGTYYQLYSATTSVLPSSGCAVTHTAAGTQAKVASMPNFILQSGTTFELVVVNANSYNGKITLNINGKGAKDVWINGAISSSSNKTLPAGTYCCHYDGSKYLIDTTYAVPSSRGVNDVTNGNMQAVSSNAVYNALSGTIISSASQVIDSAGTITYGMNSPVLGAYDYDLITFLGGNTPAGCHREYILSFQGSTNNGQYIRVRLNNIATEWINTWSADSFRKIAMVRFKESDITLEPTLGYTHQNGINLYYESSGGDSGSIGKIWNVTLTRLVVKD